MLCCEASSGVGAGLWLGRCVFVQLWRPEFSSVPYIVGGMDTVRVLLGPWLPGCPGPLLHGVAGCGYHPAQGVWGWPPRVCCCTSRMMFFNLWVRAYLDVSETRFLFSR